MPVKKINTMLQRTLETTGNHSLRRDLINHMSDRGNLLSITVAGS